MKMSKPVELKRHNLRPYSELCDMLTEKKKCAYVSATGTGKSFVVAKYIVEHDLSDKTLILVPNNVIRNNWAMLSPGIQIRTYHGMCYSEYNISGIELLVCDEMHHLGATDWGSLYRNLIAHYDGEIIGLSATPIRFLDKCRDMTIEFFEGNVVRGLDLPQAISEGVLPSFDYTTALYNLPEHVAVATARKGAPVYTEALIKRLDLMNSQYTFKRVLQEKLCDDEIHKVAVFVDRISRIEEVKAICESAFPKAAHYVAHSALSEGDADIAVAQFSNDQTTCFLYTVDMFNEGAHIDGVDTVIMFRKTESPIVYLQQLGRAMTHSMANRRVSVFDFVANHTNLRAVLGGSGTVVDWIQKGIENDSRQIAVSDYALEELEVLDKLKALLRGGWSPEEDALVIEKFSHRKGLLELLERLPNRTRNAIVGRAIVLGVTAKKLSAQDDYEAFQEDIRRFYLEPDGLKKLQDLYPDVNVGTIRGTANRMNLKRREATVKWSEAEEEFLRQHADWKQCDLIRELERTGPSIGRKKNMMGVSSKVEHHVWNEDEDQILRDNQVLTASELIARFFPNLNRSIINSRRQILGVSRKIGWSDDELQLLARLYAKGGITAIRTAEIFKDVSEHRLREAISKTGAKSPQGLKTKRWSDDEINELREYLRLPESERCSISKLSSRYPHHPYSSVVGLFDRLRKAEMKG